MKNFKYVLGLLIVIATITAVFWLAGRFGGGEKVESEKPAVVCKKENECYWTAHIHATIKMTPQAKKAFKLSFERGNLEGVHTHSEIDKLHWHVLIPVDPGTKEVKDWSKLSVGQIPSDLGLPKNYRYFFVVNGEQVYPDYIWKDGDVIEIIPLTGI